MQLTAVTFRILSSRVITQLPLVVCACFVHLDGLKICLLSFYVIGKVFTVPPDFFVEC